MLWLLLRPWGLTSGDEPTGAGCIADLGVLMSLFFLIPLVVVLGLLIGSFLTVVADRVPRGGNINRPPSACGNCDLRLGPLDLVPVISWLALGGKCRRCRNPIGIEPIVIELMNVAIWVAFALRFVDDATIEDSIAVLPAFLIFGSVLVVAELDRHS